MKGAVLMGRYKVVNYLDQGSFGFIFTISDMNNDIKNDHDLVLKIGDDIEGFQEEILTLKKLDIVQKRMQEQLLEEQKTSMAQRQVVTKLVQYGPCLLQNYKKMDEEKQVGYYIMQRYRINLKDYVEQCHGLQKVEQILTVCEQLFDSLKVVHTAGRVYNDLKPENVMISFNEQGGQVQEQVTLIDFGLTSKYMRKDKTHIQDSEITEIFCGNIHFASLDQMNFYRTSRKDDIISLFLMMIWLLNNNDLVGEPKDIDEIKALKRQGIQDIDIEFNATRTYK